MKREITQKELEEYPLFHGRVHGLKAALNSYVELEAFDDAISEEVAVRFFAGELRDIQIISTDDRIVVQLAID